VAPPGDRQRLDVWLWCARVAKTRAACAALVESGAVRINRQPTVKPHARIAPGDVLTLALGQGPSARILIWRVLALAERRGPPSEAARLYQDLDAEAG
jgi:ribosome-associated heat shock protein Hsp15